MDDPDLGKTGRSASARLKLFDREGVLTVCDQHEDPCSIRIAKIRELRDDRTAPIASVPAIGPTTIGRDLKLAS